MNLTSKKIFIVFVVISIFGYVLFVSLVFQPKSNNPTANISKYDKLTPGTTNEKSLTTLYGKPAAVQKNGDTSTLFYNSSKLYQYDYVWTKNGRVIAVKEAFPEKTTKEQASMGLGSPNDVFYDADLPDDLWFVFYEKGVAIKTADNIAYSLVRFSPQSKDSFLVNIAPLIGATATKPKYEGETL